MGLSHDFARLMAEIFLLADSQPTRHFCKDLPRFVYNQSVVYAGTESWGT